MRQASPVDAPGAYRIVAIANQKGGVGKTTTAVNLAAALGQLGFSVLLVDLDPQGNASTGIGLEPEARVTTTYDVITGRAQAEAAVLETPVPGVSAIPATIDLAGAEIELVSQFSRESRLATSLASVRDDFDLVVLDCPPSLGLLSVNALAAADEVLVPIQCEYYALEGVGQLLRNLRMIRQNVNRNLRLNGIVLTMFDSRTRLAEQVVAEVRRYFGTQVYETVIPRSVRLSEAPGYGRPIIQYDPSSRGARAYRSLAEEFIARGAAVSESLGHLAEDVPQPRSSPDQRRDAFVEPVAGTASEVIPDDTEASSESSLDAMDEVESGANLITTAAAEAGSAVPERRSRWPFKRQRGGGA